MSPVLESNKERIAEDACRRVERLVEPGESAGMTSVRRLEHGMGEKRSIAVAAC